MNPSMLTSLQPERLFLSTAEAAALLGVTCWTIQRWAAGRFFPVYRHMKHLRFRRDDLVRYAESRRQPAAQDDAYASPKAEG